MTASLPDVAAVRAIVAEVVDPELPVLTIDDLGILRQVDVQADGHITVTITPTYSGCPAMESIREDITAALRDKGFENVSVRSVLSPAWTTDWMTESGRKKLLEYGIAPPQPRTHAVVTVALTPRCPQCGSADTRELSRFGSTSCKALWVCTACREPFDSFKAI